jgi:hypothetical protein
MASGLPPSTRKLSVMISSQSTGWGAARKSA